MFEVEIRGLIARRCARAGCAALLRSSRGGPGSSDRSERLFPTPRRQYGRSRKRSRRRVSPRIGPSRCGEENNPLTVGAGSRNFEEHKTAPNLCFAFSLVRRHSFIYYASTMSLFVLCTNATTSSRSEEGTLKASRVALRCPKNADQSLSLIFIPL